MADVLTAPLAVAALVLVVAGVAKLRAPGARRSGAAGAGSAGGGATDSSLRERRDRARRLGARGANQRRGDRTGLLLRGVRSAGAAAGRPPGRLRMLRRQATFPRRRAQALLSAVLAVASAAAAAWAPARAPGSPRRSGRGPLIGIAASAYATVLAYTQLPAAWSAWSAR